MSGSSANKTLLGSAKVGPVGTRPPPVNWGLIGLRLAVVACLLLCAARPPLLAWAASVPALPPTTVPLARPTTGPRPPPMPPTQRVTAIAAQAVRTVLRPPAFSLIWGVGLLGLVAVALELALAAARLVVYTISLRRAEVVYLRIRLPQTTAGRGATSSGRDPGTDLLRAIHELLPAYGAPWLALTLRARPDEPAEVGVAVGGGSRREREGWAAALRKVVAGQSPEALVEVVPDPLAARLAPGARVAWRVWLPSQPPAYPLRLHTDTDRTDLLGPLAAAVAPRAGTSYGEVQVVLRPHRGWDLTQGWRAQALRRLLRLKGRHEYALGPDAAALEAKLAGPVYEASVRAVVVSEGAAPSRAARAGLAEIGAALGQYAARSGSRLQRLSVAAGGSVLVPQARRRPWIAYAGVLLALGVGAGVWLVLDLSPSQLLLTGHIGMLALPLRWLLPAMVALAGLLAVERWRGATAASRLRPVTARAPRMAPFAPLLWPLRVWRAPGVLAPVELGGLWHLPTPALARLARWLPCRQLPAPPHALVEGAADRLVIGTARRSDGGEAPAGPTLRDLRQVLHLTAGMGAGKSRFLANLCQQLTPHGLTLIDGKGDDESGSLVATVRRLIPQEDEARLIILDVLDTDWPIGLNPLAGVNLQQPGGADLAVGQVLATFARLDPATWGKAMGTECVKPHWTRN